MKPDPRDSEQCLLVESPSLAAKALPSPTTFRVHIAGESGVGKSTLLNALLADENQVLPSGGVGPLTATPTHIRYAAAPSVQLLFDLGKVQRLQRDLALTPLDPRVRAEACCLLTGSPYADVAPVELQARLALAASDLPLPSDSRREVSALRAALRGSPRRSLHDVHAERIHTLLTETIAGSLSPLVARADVGWPAAVLRDGIELIDLPGSGILFDPFASKMSALQHAEAAIIVVERSGIGHALGDLLKPLLRAIAQLEKDPEALIIAVTKLDQVASSAVRRLRERPAWIAQHEPELRRQIHTQLSGLMSIDPQRTSRIPVIPVLPTEHVKVIHADDVRPSILESAAESGIGRLRAVLRDARVRRQRRVMNLWLDAVSKRS